MPDPLVVRRALLLIAWALILPLALAVVGCSAEAPAAVTVTASVTATEIASFTLTPEPEGTVTEQVTATEQQTVVETTTLPPPAPAVAFNDGTYIVGTQVEPGTYQADNRDHVGCYWQRLDAAGETIDNDYEGSTIMVVKSSDFAIQTSDCGNWAKVG